MSSSSDEEYLGECQEKYMPVPPFDRYIYVLPHRVIKKHLSIGETGFNGYIPDFATVSARDDNELKSLELVREHTDIPVPRVLHQGKGLDSLALLREETNRFEDVANIAAGLTSSSAFTA